MCWYSFTSTWCWRRFCSVESCSRQGSRLCSKQIAVSWWSLWIPPFSSLPWFISSRTPLIPSSNDHLNLMLYLHSNCQHPNKPLLLNIGVVCLFLYRSVQFSSVAQLCPTLCDPMNRSTPGLPVHHHLPEFTQTHVHRVHDAIQPSHPRSSPSPPAPNPSQHQSLFQWVSSSHEVSKVLELQL